MPSVKIRNLPKATAIPRPVQASHKPRQYPQLQTLKPEVNWSGHNVLPAIHTKDNLIKNEKDLNDTEPTPYNNISDSEFLFDQMTAELEEMIEREAKIKIVREKSFTQYLELKSDYMDWVIKMAHNNVWVPVKDNGMSGQASIDQSSARSDLNSKAPSPPACLKDPTINTGNCELLMSTPPAYAKGQPITSLGADNIVAEPPASTNDQQPTSSDKVVPKSPVLCPEEKFIRKHSNHNDVPKSQSYPMDKPPSRLSTQDAVPKPPSQPKHQNDVPKLQSYPMEKPPSRLSTQDAVPKPPSQPKHKFSIKNLFSKREIFVPRPPAYPRNKSPMKGESQMIVPSPPSYPRDRNRNCGNACKPDINPEIPTPSSSFSCVSELMSPRINLALI